MNTTIKHSLLCFTLLSSCLLLGCGGCASTDKNGDTTANPQKTADTTASNNQGDVLNKTTSLSGEAIYTYLLFQRALQQGHVMLMVQSLEKLDAFSPPASVYVDAGIWALENSAPPLIPMVKKGLEKHPDTLSLHLLYAEILQKNGNTDAAIEHMQHVIAQKPHEVDAKVELSLLLSHVKKFAEAEEVLLTIAEQDRTSLVDYYQAKALMGLKRKDEAIKYLESSVEKDPEFIDALNDLAFLYEQSKELRKARDAYEQILDAYGTNYELVLRVILLSLHLQETEKALELFEDSPMTPELTVTVASMFVDAQQYDVAEPILLGLADIEDAPQDLYFYLAAIAYERDHDAQQAYDWLTHIDNTHKEFSRALFLRVKLLVDEGQYDTALKEARLGTQIDPKNLQFWTIEAQILASQGDFDNALQKLTDLEENWPHNAEVTYLRAAILDQSGDKKNAFKTMEALLQTEPDHVQALNYVGYSLAEESRELQRAIHLLRKADRLAPNNNYILDSLAWALFKAGERQEAWSIIKQAVEAEGMPEATIWEHYGDIARSLGKKDEAHKGYNRALEFSPKNGETIKYKQDQL